MSPTRPDVEAAAPGRREGGGGAGHVRPHRPPLRPGEPGHDLPHGRRLAAPHRARPRPAAPGSVVLDLACGTGRPVPRAGRGRAPAGRRRPVPGHAGRTPAPTPPWSRPTSCACPCPTAPPTALTCGFALRNLRRPGTPSSPSCARVLRPGGRIALLEVAEPDEPGAPLRPRRVLRQGGALRRWRCCPTPPPTATCPGRWPTCRPAGAAGHAGRRRVHRRDRTAALRPGIGPAHPGHPHA